MTKSKLRRAIAAVLCLACVILVVVGGINLPKKDKDAGYEKIADYSVFVVFPFIR